MQVINQDFNQGTQIVPANMASAKMIGQHKDIVWEYECGCIGHQAISGGKGKVIFKFPYMCWRHKSLLQDAA